VAGGAFADVTQTVPAAFFLVNRFCVWITRPPVLAEGQVEGLLECGGPRRFGLSFSWPCRRPEQEKPKQDRRTPHLPLP
jgi:hypothetical protein